LLLFIPIQARAINTPVMVQSCSAIISHSLLSQSCTLENTTSGNTIIIDSWYGCNSCSASMSGTGETLTCPGTLSVSQPFFSGIQGYFRCFVTTTANHATFTATASITAGAMTGVIAREIQGLGAVDTGSYSACANCTSTSTTTAANNEWVDAACWGAVSDIASGTGFTQSIAATSVTPLDAGVSASNHFGYAETQFVATAGTISPSCSFTSIYSSLTGVVPTAWAISGAPSPSSISIIQHSAYNWDGGANSGTGVLYNVGSGHKIVIGFLTNNTNAPPVNFTCTETCTCPSGSQVQHTYSRAMISGVCYADTTSSHAKFTFFESDGIGTPVFILGMELTGVLTSYDTSSPAAAAAQTVNYTTVSPNEYTFTFGADTTGTTIAPASSFNPINGMLTYSGSILPFVGLSESKVTATSGSGHTTSFTSANSTPMISELSFGVSNGGFSYTIIM
jgi:hypothetical protein